MGVEHYQGNRSEFCGELAKHYDGSRLVLVEIPNTGHHWLWSEAYCLEMIQQCEIEQVAQRMLGEEPQIRNSTTNAAFRIDFTQSGSGYHEVPDYRRAKMRWEAHLSRVRHHTRER